MLVKDFERLISEYEKDLYSFCCYLAAGAASDMAGDLYQDTVLAAFEMRGRINPDGNPKSLLFSIAVGKWKNARRKAVRRQAIAPQQPLEEFDYAAAGRENVEADVQARATQEAVQAAVNSLEDKFRIPLILHYFDDMGLEAIGGVMGLPKGTVKSRLHKARALMKVLLAKETEGLYG
ncbi:MAG: RNA polymerase sigma factor [Defluviitaleaceae bacterium]|nr:RNA polymerase sigma factor [Defluviitaleaceae bacterium]